MMPVGTEVGLGPGDFVLYGDPATTRKRVHPPHPIFGPCLLWLNGWMDEDTTWYGNRPRPRPHCIRRGPISPQKGHSRPLFSDHVYCGYGRPSQLLLSSCSSLFFGSRAREPVSVDRFWRPARIRASAQKCAFWRSQWFWDCSSFRSRGSKLKSPKHLGREHAFQLVKILKLLSKLLHRFRSNFAHCI